MGLFKSIGKAISNLWNWGGNVLGGANFEYQKPVMDYQMQLEREARQTYYGDAKKSLLDAGYNPLMAILGGSSAQSLSTSSTGQSIGGELGAIANLNNSATNRDMFKIANNKNNAEIGLLRAQTDTETTKQQLNSAESLNRIADTIIKNKEASWYDKEKAMQLKNLSADTLAKTVGASVEQMNASTNRMNANTNRYMANVEQINANTRNYEAKTERMKHAGEIARELNDYEFTKKHPRMSNFGNMVRKHTHIFK